mmetsp:Transcript_29813/g.60516  ORF Transcript_29813/g.60516 Transcript_29813/m.60516 type:complete len:122 (+) Transcript_29813:273-638(+)
MDRIPEATILPKVSDTELTRLRIGPLLACAVVRLLWLGRKKPGGNCPFHSTIYSSQEPIPRTRIFLRADTSYRTHNGRNGQEIVQQQKEVCFVIGILYLPYHGNGTRYVRPTLFIFTTYMY